MDQERNQVLEMLRAGRINAEEAQTLLAALEASALNERGGRSGGDALTSTAPIEQVPPAPSPDFDRFRRFWRYPFAGTTVLALILGLLLISMTANAAGRITLALLCTWPFFLASLFLALTFLWSRRATWIHVRVQEQDRRRVAISLPVPLRFVASTLPLIRRLVPAVAREQLDTALDLLDEMRRLPPGEPLFLDVDDEDGERVQVYVG